MHAAPVSLDRIYDLFERVLNQPAPAPEVDLFDSGTLDSLEFTNLLLVLDHEFDLKLSFDSMDLERFRSLGGIARFVAAHTGLAAVLPELGDDDADRLPLAQLENAW